VRDILGEDSETFGVEGRAIYSADPSKTRSDEDINTFSGSTVNGALPPLSSRNPESQEMYQALEKVKKETSDALCDSFNTPLVMAAISELISTFNTIVDKAQLSMDVVKIAGQFVTSVVNLLGLNGNASPQGGAIGWSGISIPDAAKPYVYPVAKLRDELRRKARSPGGLKPEDLDLATNLNVPRKESTAAETESYAKMAEKFSNDVSALRNSSNLSKEVLQLCDRLRDVDLWDKGIYLEDRDDSQPALVRPVTKEQLAARREKETKERQKQQAKDDAARGAAEKAQQGKLSHLEMFRTPEYAAWDDDGIPTKDSQGEEVTKSKRKKLAKDWERQKKLHEKWVKANA
jgi:cysteinyl-tRNA synthetase